MSGLPLERFRDLSDIPAAGFELDIAPGADELRALAKWAGVDDISQLKAHVSVTARSKTRFLEEVQFDATVVQSCVVTLQPVRTEIARNFTRALLWLPGVHRFAEKGGTVVPAAVDEDAPDEIDSPVYDLGTPLREELALAIDPYPRAPGVAFQPPPDEDHRESPFAALEKLKPRSR